ncbi:hypothetical protein RND81_05G152500 [Saponaria officinalis]|uniref:GATA-type domain-containing protein n=1 Tax=Saponaria officinalis TaxID=3572 RepID=A0AAW1KYN1_SAPOF
MDILLLSKYELQGFVEEEELEWISNEDAFPMSESFVDIIPNHPTISHNSSSSSHLSPVSVLENSITNSFDIDNCNNNVSNIGCGETSSISAMVGLTGIFKVPGKARTRQTRKRRSGQRFPCWEKSKPIGNRMSSGRKCVHCGSERTPQWRAGPSGPKTLCNACGVRYMSGRLVPEYRPACSPTFSSELHSNSHRKIVEMRKQKMGVDV